MNIYLNGLNKVIRSRTRRVQMFIVKVIRSRTRRVQMFIVLFLSKVIRRVQMFIVLFLNKVIRSRTRRVQMFIVSNMVNISYDPVGVAQHTLIKFSINMQSLRDNRTRIQKIRIFVAVINRYVSFDPLWRARLLHNFFQLTFYPFGITK
jgi:hypothetical protein